MSLTLEQIQKVNIPINVYNKPNNLRDASRGIQLYNDSVNLFDAINLFVATSSPSNTDLSITTLGNVSTIFSSTGADVVLPLATTTSAGLMSLSDKIKLDAALSSSSLNIGSGLTGDGSIGDPLDWAGAFVAGPLTGSGTSFFPLNILNNSITTAHIQTGTILFSDWNQNGASSGQVPKWNGSAWVVSTITGLLPSGVAGNQLFHDGTSWVALQRVVETITGIASTTFNLASLPKSYAPIDLYRNGDLQTYTDDYSRSGVTISCIEPLVAWEKVTIIYYI